MQIANERRLFSGKRSRDMVLAALIAAALYLCWLLVKPFLAAIAWALALAIVAEPWHRRLERHFRPSAAALVTVLLIVTIVLVPGIFLVQSAIDEISHAFSAIGNTTQSGAVAAALERIPLLSKAVRWVQQRYDLTEELRGSARTLAQQASTLVSGSARVFVQFGMMFVILFFFLRDRGKLVRSLRSILPLAAAETDELFERVSKTVHATVYGNVVVKIVQGALGGGMLWALGFPAPVILGVATALCAMVPVIGTSLVWGPAAILLLIQGSWAKAALLAVWGALVVSLIDNLLYPILVAAELRLHTLGVLLSVLGGLIAFGAAGVVLGPVIFASTIALFGIWEARLDHEPRF